MAKKYLRLREKYPRFGFEDYSWNISGGDLNISFYFKIYPNIRFYPKIVIKNINKKRVKKIGDRVLNNLVFQLGLIEMLSYWKAACSPEIIIKTGILTKEQIKWWRDLIMKGMGQFFYENKIDFTEKDFLEINSTGSNVDKIDYREKLKDRILVPVGGGKDSVVTLELLRKTKRKIVCFVLNPTKVAKKLIKIAIMRLSKPPDCEGQIIIKRNIDKKLLELNRKGFLNGHTPFSAYLSFLTILSAVLFDFKNVVFSNERSSNEGNLEYLGETINHQYSKSFDFENNFRKYSQKYLAKNVEYFSFLRPLYEVQVARLFVKHSKYFPVFVSCNEAFRTYSGEKKSKKKWCNRCPKCLFVFASLYPFLGEYQMMKIFRENLLEKISNLPIMLELIGEKRFKPFECVGTSKESLIAFYLSWKKEKKKKKKSFLLEHFERNILPKHSDLEKEAKQIMSSWNKKHNLPKQLKRILKRALRS